MATRYNLNTDHWSKMRMNVSENGPLRSRISLSMYSWIEQVIKNAINGEQRGRVMSWEKHQKVAAQRELEAAIRGTRSLPQNEVGLVHNFEDVLTVELNGYVPGSGYFRRRIDRDLDTINGRHSNIVDCKWTSSPIERWMLILVPLKLVIRPWLVLGTLWWRYQLILKVIKPEVECLFYNVVEKFNFLLSINSHTLRNRQKREKKI